MLRQQDLLRIRSGEPQPPRHRRRNDCADVFIRGQDAIDRLPLKSADYVVDESQNIEIKEPQISREADQILAVKDEFVVSKIPGGSQFDPVPLIGKKDKDPLHLDSPHKSSLASDLGQTSFGESSKFMG